MGDFLRFRTACVLLGLLALSCAIPEPPPGGPEDKTAPAVVGSRPGDGSAGVPVNASISLDFSEKIGPGRIDRFVELFPPASIAKTRWKENTLLVEFEKPLHPDTTYLVRVKPGFVDSHNVKSEKPYEFAFATSAELDTGSIGGRVYFRRKPTGKAVVRLFRVPTDSSFAPESARPDREVTTAEDGSYALDYLPARGDKFILWAFEDDDVNSAFSPETEVGASLRDTLALASDRPSLEGRDIYIVDPKEPAKITGRAINATLFDSIPVTVTLEEMLDSVPRRYYIRANPQGQYSFDNVLKGTFLLHAFIDLKKDSVCGSYPCLEDSTAPCIEPCAAYPDSLVVGPGDERRLKDIRVEAVVQKEK